MKHFLTVLLCLLLWGCTPKQQTAPAQTAPQAPTEESITMGMHDPNHPMQTRYPGQIRAYPLTQRKVHGMRAFGSDLLTLSGQGNTTLTLLSGYDLQVAAARTVGFELTQEDPSLQIHSGCISFFDPRQQETVVLDHRLQEVRRIAVPHNISGKPILSSDTGTLYYCTPWAVVAWDLETGIRRTVKELQYSAQELSSLLWNDQVLACTLADEDQTKTLLLSADNGRELHTLPEGAKLSAKDSSYFLSRQDGFQNLLIFSRDAGEKELLLPKELADAAYYLDQNHAAITVTSRKDGVCLDYYELQTGILRSELMLENPQTPKSIVNCQDHAVYILVYDAAEDCDTIYRWDAAESLSETADTVSHTFPYPDKETPDREALEQCREFAHSIGQKYGISVKIWEDACQVQPWDYQFAPEQLAPVLQKELHHLDQRLAQYPAELLQQTAGHFSGLNICLVRSISGSTDAASLSSPTGIQFLEDRQAYVVITTGKYAEQALYHELYHVMETHILTESSALDQWEALNPTDFSYGTGNTPDIYLQGQTRAFVDSYSMSSPKEDRARILENALLQGKEELFRSEYMQRKLAALCQGIREAYGLTKVSEPLPWEQYLVTSLVPNT